MMLLQARRASAATGEGAEAQRQALLSQAEVALRQGRAEEARTALDTAAAMSHAADTELLQIQTMLQQGAFRQALGFAAHTAGAHLQAPQALALHAWLLALAEQSERARQLLSSGLQRHPDDAQLQHLGSQIDRLQEGASAESNAEAAGLRPRPIPSGAAIPAGARAIGSGTVLADGETAVVACGSRCDWPTGTVMWLRNGVGHAMAARWQQALPGWPLGWLRLDAPAPHPEWQMSKRLAHAGSPVSLVLFPADPSDMPAWPALQSGFMGRPASLGRMSLGFAAAVASPGALAFDRRGESLGLLLPAHPGDSDLLLPWPVIQTALRQVGGPAEPGTDAPAQPVATPTPEELYERSLRSVVQLWVDTATGLKR